MQTTIVIGLLRNRTVRGAILLAALAVLCLPVLVAGSVAGVLGEDSAAACGGIGEAVSEPAAGGTVAAGMFATPLKLEAGHWYEVGATEYGGPNDPTSSDYGAIPDPSQSYLPDHPDSFAELSVLNTNPASSGSFSFADADALNELPYLTNLRVRHAGRELLLAKRDVGYGQGPGQMIGNGEPYRLDVWWQAAETLGVSKSAVNIRLAPQTGAAGALEDLPESQEADAGATADASEYCEADLGEGPLPLTAGTRTKI
ncbi:MAG: hypothetical protein ACRDNS_18205, partial [Trebonia sp.]